MWHNSQLTTVIFEAREMAGVHVQFSPYQVVTSEIYYLKYLLSMPKITGNSQKFNWLKGLLHWFEILFDLLSLN